MSFWHFSGTDPKTVIQNERKNDLRLMFDDFVHFFDTLVWLVRFRQSTIKFFPMKQMKPCFKFYDFREVLLGEKTNDSRLTVITISVIRHVPRASSGSFLVRTASQSQRGGSIINMKGTERDRSKASINKGVWIV